MAGHIKAPYLHLFSEYTRKDAPVWGLFRLKISIVLLLSIRLFLASSLIQGNSLCNIGRGA